MILCICLLIYPDEEADKIRSFIIANGGLVYSRQDISKRCKELELTRKMSSHQAYKFSTQENIAKSLWFVSFHPPLGVLDVRLNQLININETGFCLSSIHNKYGRGHTNCRIRSPSHYIRSEKKANIIMAVEPGSQIALPFREGSVMFPRRWILITQSNCDQ